MNHARMSPHLPPHPQMDWLLTSLVASPGLLSLTLALLLQRQELDTQRLHCSHGCHFLPDHSLAMGYVLEVITYQHYDSKDIQEENP